MTVQPWTVTQFTTLPGNGQTVITAITDLATHLFASFDTIAPVTTPRYKFRRGVSIECGYYLQWANASCAEQAEVGDTLQHTITVPLNPTYNPFYIALGTACPLGPGIPATPTVPIVELLVPCYTAHIHDDFTRPNALLNSLQNMGQTDTGETWLQTYATNVSFINPSTWVHGIQANRAILLGFQATPILPNMPFTDQLLFPSCGMISTDHQVSFDFAQHTILDPSDPTNNGHPSFPIYGDVIIRWGRDNRGISAGFYFDTVQLWEWYGGPYNPLTTPTATPTIGATYTLRAIGNTIELRSGIPPAGAVIQTATTTWQNDAHGVAIAYFGTAGVALNTFDALSL